MGRWEKGNKTPNKIFNLTYLGVTDLAYASSAPPKTQVKIGVRWTLRAEENLRFVLRLKKIRISQKKGPNSLIAAVETKNWLTLPIIVGMI